MDGAMGFLQSPNRRDAVTQGNHWATEDALLELWLPADPCAVPEARHQVMRVCQQAGVPEYDCLGLDIALGEALANAVVHGARPASGGTPVCVRLWDYRGNLIIQVADQGPGFDPPAPPYPMPESHEETHGRGLPLMDRLTDAMLACRGDVQEGGAAVYLIKALGD